MKNNLVSIIMPAYNGEKYIKQAINSVCDQSYKNWELLVIDDGSTDDTAGVVSTFDDPRIHYVFQENHGQATALNRGLEMALGDYITTLDADDWFTQNSISDRVDFLELNKHCGVVYGDGIFCNIDGKPLKRFSTLRNREMIGDVYGFIISNSFYGTGANVLIRKGVLDKHGIRYDEFIVWCQDLDLYIRLAEVCLFGYVNTITVWYRTHASNMTSSMSQDRRRDSLFRTKLKVLSSPRFYTISDVQKKQFFHHLLFVNLSGLLDKQLLVLQSPGFIALPDRLRAVVIRWVVAKYIFAGKHLDEMRILMKKAWALNPFDLKSIGVLFLSQFAGGALMQVLIRYISRISMKVLPNKKLT